MQAVLLVLNFLVNVLSFVCIILPILILLINKKKKLNLNFIILFLLSSISVLALFLFVNYSFDFLDWALFFDKYDLNNDNKFDSYEISQNGFEDSENDLYNDTGRSILFYLSVHISFFIVVINFIFFYSINYFLRKYKS